ncbi:MAG: hypothetical protein K5640_01370 [Treponema sp.]|nr:hypothetical protein [Treponema sp.]
MHFIHTNEPGNDEFSNRLSALVEKIKDNEKFRREYAAMNLHDFDITKAAKREGPAEKAIEDAVTIVKKYNIKPEQTAEDIGAPLEKVLIALKG